MAHECACHSGPPAVLDVRDLAPRVRHPKIFETFDAMAPGGTFILVNDHDPKPLLYQFRFERAGAFRWRYLQEGPEVWRVEIGKSLPPVRAEQTVGDVAHHYPRTLEVMKEMGINHCCGAQLTLSEAAASAGVPLDALLGALNETRKPPEGREGVAERGGSVADLAEARQVHLDVREDIARGREPFTRIMAAVKSLGADQALVLRAPFEPIPLYDVLGKRGFAHWTERRAPDDWSVRFYRDATPAARPGPAPAAAAPGRVVLDVRGLEPPQPMVQVLQQLDRLGPDAELEVRHDRRPMFLYPQLDERGFAHETDEPEPGLVRIVIRKGAI